MRLGYVWVATSAGDFDNWPPNRGWPPNGWPLDGGSSVLRFGYLCKNSCLPSNCTIENNGKTNQNCHRFQVEQG